MKGGLRGKRFPLALVAMICTTLIIWAWERTPLRTTFFSSTDQFDMLSPGIIIGTPVSESIYTHQQPSSDDDISDPGTHENPSIYTHQQPSSDEDIADPGTHENPSIENAEQVPSDPPMDSTTLSSLKNITKATDLIMMPTEKKECNYAKGKWVADEKRPLYSGFSCNQWLSKMWACRWMKRKDFSYESFRWQPYQCEMPEFEGSKFLRRMQNKTVALVGDSLGRQQFQSLMCMVTGGKESPQVQDVGGEYGLAKSRGALRPDGWAYRFPSTNTTILYYWSASLCELEPLNRSNPSTTIAMHLDRPVWFLKHYLHRFDVLVLNTGHHWNRGKLKANRWEIYVGGAPKILDIASAKNLAVYNVIKWLDSQIPRHSRLKAFFRTMSPRHFVNGDWNTGGSCDSVTPLLRGSEVSQEGSSDPVIEGAVKGTKVNILDITALSQLRDEGHISKYSVKTAEGPHDCLHWCLPGIPDTWNELLFAQL